MGWKKNEQATISFYHEIARLQVFFGVEPAQETIEDSLCRDHFL